MSFLKKFGQAVLKVVGVVSGIMPVVQALTPTIGQSVVSEITAIVSLIQNVEVVAGVTGATGDQKRVAGGALVAQVIQQSEFFAGKKVANEAAFILACQTIAGGTADLLNSLDESAVQVRVP